MTGRVRAALGATALLIGVLEATGISSAAPGRFPSGSRRSAHMGLTAVWPSLVDAIHRAKLTAPDGADGDRFGGAVALDGETAIVGAASDDTTEEDTGSAYVFVRSGTVWTPQAKLTGTGPGDDSFGESVAIDGDTAVIGAPDDDPGGYGGRIGVRLRPRRDHLVTSGEARRFGPRAQRPLRALGQR